MVVRIAGSEAISSLRIRHEAPGVAIRLPRSGQAIANILFGGVNPSAKLPVSLARNENDLPHPQIAGLGLAPQPGAGGDTTFVYACAYAGLRARASGQSVFSVKNTVAALVRTASLRREASACAAARLSFGFTAAAAHENDDAEQNGQNPADHP